MYSPDAPCTQKTIRRKQKARRIAGPSLHFVLTLFYQAAAFFSCAQLVGIKYGCEIFVDGFRNDTRGTVSNEVPWLRA